MFPAAAETSLCTVAGIERPSGATWKEKEEEEDEEEEEKEEEEEEHMSMHVLITPLHALHYRTHHYRMCCGLAFKPLRYNNQTILYRMV